MTDPRTSRRLQFGEHGRFVDEWEAVFPGIIVDHVRHGDLAYRAAPVYAGVFVNAGDMDLSVAHRKDEKLNRRK